jgi:GDP-L-fucose synthase
MSWLKNTDLSTSITMNKINQNSTVLVTGAAGGLGKALTAALARQGYAKVLAPTRQDLDLLDAGSVERYFANHRPNSVIHLASVVFGLQGNLDNQMRSLMENTQINANVFSAINNHPVDYVFFAGTVASYAYPYKTIPLSETDFFDGLPHGGEFGYAMSKRHAYAYLKVLKDTKNVGFTYGVFTNLYGENDRFNDNSGHVIPSLIMKAHKAKIEDKPFSVWGDGSAERDFLHFDDASNAIIACMKEGKTPELVNISSGMVTTIKYLSELVCKAAGVNNIEYQADKPVGIKSRVVDNSRLTELGFRQEVSLEAGIARLYEWYSKNVIGVRV